MDRLVSLVTGAPKVRRSNDDDFADRLYSRYTTALCILFAVLTTMNQYVRNPITCWAPVHFSGAHAKFATNFCWVKNTYYLPWDQEMPKPEEPRQYITYYQWVSIFLLIQAAFNVFPSFIWHSLNSKGGIDADNILAGAHRLARSETTDSHQKTLRLLTKQMDRFFSSKQKYESKLGLKCLLTTVFCRMCGRRNGSYLLALFLISKICYIAIGLFQLFGLSAVLATRYNTFGIDMLSQFTAKGDWTEDGYVAFPRVTYCDFPIRGQDLGNVQNYTVQCVLPVNMYNEKIYMFIWFWLVGVTAVACASFLVWLVRSLSFNDKLKFVKNHLELGRRTVVSLNESEIVEKFVRHYLRNDGSFLLRLIAHNTNNVTTTEVICDLWDYWRENNTRTPSTTDGRCRHLYPDMTEMETIDECATLKAQ